MDVKEFAIAFTVAVTEVSDPAVDLVAKNGEHSIFSTLERIFPQARERSCVQLAVLDTPKLAR
jgi:hypothetical protein